MLASPPVSGFIGEAQLFGFLFTLTRISGVIAFLPLPGMKATPTPARVLLAFAFTVALAPLWMTRPVSADLTSSHFVAGILTEAAIGLGIGITVGIVIEIFQAAAQIVSLQAGLSYASTIDPTSGADSAVLVTVAQLASALLFITTGADRALFRVLAETMVANPPGAILSLASTAGAGNAIFHFGSNILASGLRLAAPIAVLLILADVLLAVFGRLQPSLQLTSLSFPFKLGATMLLIVAMLRFYPRFFESSFGQALRLIERLLSGG